jgi:hypothetical protein
MVSLDGLYGHEQNGALWRGLVGYAKYSLTKSASPAGTRTGVDQTPRGFPFTSEYLLGARFSRLNSRFRRADGKFVVRGDLRLDVSDRDVFLEGPDLVRKRQFTSAVNLIY